MHRETRRKDRTITEEEARVVLEKAEYGFLGTVSPENEPYVVPLSYVAGRDNIYFHCATVGEKLDNIAKNPAACFCVVGATEPVYSGSFSTYYESCMVFGTVREITDEAEKRQALRDIAYKYFPELTDKVDDAIKDSWNRTALYAISIDRITGKAKRKTA